MLTPPTMLAEPNLYRFLSRTLFRLRWLTLAAMLLLTFVMPTSSTIGMPTWALVCVFALYNVVIDVLRRRWPPQFSFTLLAIVDLPIAAVLYVLSSEPGGPLFILFVLAVDSAAINMSLRGTLLYTAATGLVAAIADLTLALQSPTPMDLRLLAARLVMLALLGGGMAIVTRRLGLEQAFAQSERNEAERLEALDQLRADFVATISHDLRTPLTATRAGLGALETSALHRLQPNERQLLRTMRRNTERLNMLITDLLTFNQLESNTLHLEQELLDLRAIITDAMTAVYPLLAEKQQTLEMDLPEPLPCLGDVRRLEQVFVNVLDNAHIHTPSNTRITITGRMTDSNVLLAVSDNGPGIPATEIEEVFQRFHRLTWTKDGSGLGLAIARGIVDLHGGRIWAVSHPGDGVTFNISLPCASTDEAASHHSLHIEELQHDLQATDRR